MYIFVKKRVIDPNYKPLLDIYLVIAFREWAAQLVRVFVDLRGIKFPFLVLLVLIGFGVSRLHCWTLQDRLPDEVRIFGL